MGQASKEDRLLLVQPSVLNISVNEYSKPICTHWSGLWPLSLFISFPLCQSGISLSAACESKLHLWEEFWLFSVVLEDNTSISGISGNSFITSFPAELLPACCSCFLLSQVQDLVLVHAKLHEFPVVSFFQPLETSLKFPSVLLHTLLPLILYHLAEYHCPHTT